MKHVKQYFEKRKSALTTQIKAHRERIEKPNSNIEISKKNRHTEIMTQLMLDLWYIVELEITEYNNFGAKLHKESRKKDLAEEIDILLKAIRKLTKSQYHERMRFEYQLQKALRELTRIVTMEVE